MTKKLHLYITVLLITFLVLGIFLGKSCTKINYKTIMKRDTIESVRIVPRQIFVKPDIRIRSILIPYRDTMYIAEKIPCDTAFIVQADSTITTIGDTIYVSFNHNKDSSYFNMLVKPRPDSILTKTIEVPVVKEVEKTEFTWILWAFVVGVLTGMVATK